MMYKPKPESGGAVIGGPSITAPLQCPYCKQRVGPPSWMARATTLWSNQHGWSKRIFCSNCGAWHDVTEKEGNISIRQVHPPSEGGES